MFPVHNDLPWFWFGVVQMCWAWSSNGTRFRQTLLLLSVCSWTKRLIYECEVLPNSDLPKLLIKFIKFIGFGFVSFRLPHCDGLGGRERSVTIGSWRQRHNIHSGGEECNCVRHSDQRNVVHECSALADVIGMDDVVRWIDSEPRLISLCVARHVLSAKENRNALSSSQTWRGRQDRSTGNQTAAAKRISGFHVADQTNVEWKLIRLRILPIDDKFVPILVCLKRFGDFSSPSGGSDQQQQQNFFHPSRVKVLSKLSLAADFSSFYEI